MNFHIHNCCAMDFSAREPFTRLLIGCFLLIASMFAQANPMIEGVDLVSSTRFDRTKFDYKFALRLRGDSTNYDSASYEAKMDALGSTVLKNTINVGRLDADKFIRTVDTITVRHDRQYPFDRSKLLFQFTGVVAGSSNADNGPTISGVNFYEFGGRPGHEGSFPIRSDNPVAAADLTLRAALLGSVNTAKYSLFDSSGALLRTDNLPRAWPTLPWFAANVVVPSTKFSMEISATGVDGKTNTWRSKLFSPQTFTARIETDQGAFKFGETITAQIVGESTTAAGEYVISLIRPPDFLGDSGPWTVTAIPRGSFFVPIQIQTPAAGVPFSRYTLTLSYASKSTPQEVQYSNLTFIAR